jgi:heat-inducible transcriptional repressor
MRTLSANEQEDRKRRLLQAVIHHFIKTAKPVGSASLAEEYRLDLSPATIRNVMSELEAEGYLTHPHTSAGRVPTDKAYRFYVDSLAETQRLASLEMEKIQKEYEARIREMEELMLSTSKTLSVISRFTGFALAPTLQETRLRHMELIPLDNHRLLAVLISDSGVVKHRLITFEEPFSADLAPSLARMLNEHLRGQPFSEVRDTLLEHLEEVKLRQNELVNLARQVTRQAFDIEGGGELFMEGAGNILALPDFQDNEHVRSLVHLLDEKRAIGELIVRDLKKAKPGVQVKIGSENENPGFKDLSVISSTYTIGDRKVGVLGIIGPKRMEYSRMMGLVDYVSKTVSKVLGRLVGD